MNPLRLSPAVRRVAVAALLGAAGPAAPAASIPLQAPPPPVAKAEAGRRFAANFQLVPPLNAALSPDGKLLTYSLRDGSTTRLAVLEIDRPERMKALLQVGNDADATPNLTDDREQTPLRIRWMQWVTPTRLVIDANLNTTTYAGGWRNSSGVVLGVDADGKSPRVLLTPRDTSITRTTFASPSFGGPGYIAGPGDSGFDRDWDRHGAWTTEWQYLRDPRVFDFDPKDPQAVLVRAGDRRRYLVYSLNVATGKLKILHDEVGSPGLQTLPDRTGLIGAAIDLDTGANPPWRYVLDKRRGLLRWTPLDELAGTAAGAAGFSVSPGNFFAERAVPVGFADDRGLLYFASNVGRDTYGIYALDPKTGRRTDFAVEDEHFDLIVPATAGFVSTDPLVFDRYTRALVGVRYVAGRDTTRWLDPVLRDAQESIEASLPGRSVRLQEWDRARNRFLAIAQSPGDPGGVYVFDRAAQKLWEFTRRAPWLDTEKPHRVLEFSFARPDGAHVSGIGLVPRFARLSEVPVVFVCANQPWDRTSSEFSPRLRTLADMGFVAVQINPRGALGFGRAARDAIKKGRWDELQAEDLVAALDELARGFHIHTTRAAVLGEGLGGHLALRAVQLHPGRFRAAVAVNPVIDIGGWIEEARWTNRTWAAQLVREFFGDAPTRRDSALRARPEALTRPALVLSFPGPRGGARTFTHLEAKRFAETAKARGGRVQFVELEPEYQRRLPEATAAVYRQIEDFLNTTVYDFSVRLEPLIERDDARP